MTDQHDAMLEACRGIADDYMTSESHHPGYVLIPTAKFDAIVAALALSSTVADGQVDRLREALGSAIRDLNATYEAAKTGKPFIISIGQFHRLRLMEQVLSTHAGNGVSNPDELPSDVIALVDAGRDAWEFLQEHYPSDSVTGALNKALEAFASRVCYDDEGGELPDAHADPCTCGKRP